MTVKKCTLKLCGELSFFEIGRLNAALLRVIYLSLPAVVQEAKASLIQKGGLNPRNFQNLKLIKFSAEFGIQELEELDGGISTELFSGC